MVEVLLIFIIIKKSTADCVFLSTAYPTFGLG